MAKPYCLHLDLAQICRLHPAQAGQGVNASGPSEAHPWVGVL